MANHPVDSPGAADARRDHSGGLTVLERVWYCAEIVSLEFERWADPHAHGPGLYFVIESDTVSGSVEPMGANRWPVEDCASVFADIEVLVDAARTVALACDGAVVVHSDGTVQEEMVRVKQLSAAERARVDDLPYADWMGARHMSALETSTREAVSAVVTLSEEDGRVTVFTDGSFDDHPRDTLGGEWRPEP